MKKFFVILVAVQAIVACNKSVPVDPIHGTVPMDTTYVEGFPLPLFRDFGARGDTVAQRNMIEMYRVQLTRNVLNHYPCIDDEKDIRFLLGSGFAERVESGDGNYYDGDFRNELIIILDSPCVKDTLFLACGNGMLLPLQLTETSDFGTAERFRFVIGKGEGLATYLPQLEKWGQAAQALGIPIRNADGKVVRPSVFLTHLGKYRTVLFEGDVVDVFEGEVYDKNGNVVDFDRRLRATQNANKALKKNKPRARVRRNHR